MSMAEAVRQVQEAEAEAEAISADGRREAEAEVARARRAAAEILATAVQDAGARITRLEVQVHDEELAQERAIEQAAQAEREILRVRAGRNKAVAVALLEGLMAHLAEDDV